VRWAAFRLMQCARLRAARVRSSPGCCAPCAAARAQVFLFRAVDLGLRLSAAFQSASGAAHVIRPD